MKKIVPLADMDCRNAKPRDRAYKLFDGGGLYLEVEPGGRKVWRFKFKHAGKESRMKLGIYPATPLAGFKDKASGKRIAGARELHLEQRRLLADGVDPSQQRREDKAQKEFQAANTFSAIADEWLTLNPKSLTASTHKRARWMLETFAYPYIGKMPVTAIQPRDVLIALRALEARGKLETTHRLKARISEVFRFAIGPGRATSDPCRDLRGAIKSRNATKHHAALTEPAAVGELMRTLDGYTGTPETCAALRLAPLLFVRPGELRTAQWPHFDLDGPAPSWRYFVTKTKADHIVPLCVQAVAILRDLYPLTGGTLARPGMPHYVFPGVRSRARPMSENTVNAALRRLGYTKEQMTGHGFRATARTLLSELGWKPDAIERQLAHKASGPLGAAYDRAQYLDERRKMMQAWADYLDVLRDDRKVTAGRFGKVA